MTIKLIKDTPHPVSGKILKAGTRIEVREPLGYRWIYEGVGKQVVKISIGELPSLLNKKEQEPEQEIPDLLEDLRRLINEEE